MNVNRIPAVVVPLPAPSREEMMAVAAARPAALQAQAVALHALDRGTTGQGTPAVDGNSAIDLYA